MGVGEWPGNVSGRIHEYALLEGITIGGELVATAPTPGGNRGPPIQTWRFLNTGAFAYEHVFILKPFGSTGIGAVTNQRKRGPLIREKGPVIGRRGGRRGGRSLSGNSW